MDQRATSSYVLNSHLPRNEWLRSAGSLARQRLHAPKTERARLPALLRGHTSVHWPEAQPWAVGAFLTSAVRFGPRAL